MIAKCSSSNKNVISSENQQINFDTYKIEPFVSGMIKNTTDIVTIFIGGNMSNRTAILKKLMVATTVMTMTFGGSMTALAAEDEGNQTPVVEENPVDEGNQTPVEENQQPVVEEQNNGDQQGTVVVTIDEQAATENEKEILGNPDEAQTESETAVYEEYKESDINRFAKESGEEIHTGECYTDPETQKTPTEYAKDIEEGEEPLEPIAAGEAHITITDSSLEEGDVLEGRTEIVSYTESSSKVPLEADEESAEGTIYFVTLNSTNTSVLEGENIEAAVTVPVAQGCDDPESAVAYVDPNFGVFDPIDKVDLTYDADNGTWTVKITLKKSQNHRRIDGTEYSVSYQNYGNIYLIKYDAVKKQVVVEPAQPGEESSASEDESVIAVVDASSVATASEVSTVAPVNDYYQFNLNAAEAIRTAAYGSTVDIDAGEYVSFADFVIEEIDKRPDLTINVNYIDAANGHSQENFVIPARTAQADGTVLGESRIEEPETKFYGFKYVDGKMNS